MTHEFLIYMSRCLTSFSRRLKAELFRRAYGTDLEGQFKSFHILSYTICPCFFLCVLSVYLR